MRFNQEFLVLIVAGAAICTILITHPYRSPAEISREKAVSLMENVETTTLDSLYGYSGHARGIDTHNRPFITRISYTNNYGVLINIPSFQNHKNNSEGVSASEFRRDSLLDYPLLSRRLGVDTLNPRQSVYQTSTFIANFLNQYDLRGMSSYPILGDFIKFDLGGGCEIHYLFPNGALRGNQHLRQAFSDGLQLGDGWIIFRREQTKEFIKVMER